MDTVRFGRVLGTGARLAGRTLVAAVDAAAAPKPDQKSGQARNSAPENSQQQEGMVLPPPPRRKPEGRSPSQTPAKPRVRAADVRRQGKRFGEAVWGPVARASGVLWLEVMGVFFGLVALTGLQGMWTHRNLASRMLGGQIGLAACRPLLLSTVIALLFGYFCASNFVRAARRGRG